MKEEKYLGAYPKKPVSARDFAEEQTDGAESAYLLARLVRNGSRELERQLNLKKTR